ncbi:uncharacterized protein PV06_04826 [Exophiala oligosperma]|uniref:Superoxide dismutase n=1 Tax=Exophiala oligosperma TaxID=215243 RepID=A0A0D2AVC5_9EURO|nr:uncharacterized protein PV06_04826 [Exophiala oligosperma]KIW43756.1 hypothetical protein PV06_04826 [Exophiala oligosperma]
MAVGKYSLPRLDYELNDLEPFISRQIMELHYNRHHQTYITNLNNALALQAEAISTGNLIRQLDLQSMIKFNAGGHVNHTLFWEGLTPSTTTTTTTPATDIIEKVAPHLYQSIMKQWGNVESFKGEWESAALSIQGSGWAWLVKKVTANNKTEILEITTSKDQDLPGSTASTGKILPILGIDMWEHAYYLQYWNNKKEYVTRIWQVLNWNRAEKRFLGDSGLIYGDLMGLVGRL